MMSGQDLTLQLRKGFQWGMCYVGGDFIQIDMYPISHGLVRVV